jgi:hypothetical protein
MSKSSKQLKIVFNHRYENNQYIPDPLYELFRNEARAEGWSMLDGLREFLQERYNAKMYVRDGEIHAIKFNDTETYNEYCARAKTETQLLLF